MYYVMSDLNGCLNSWKKMLKKIGFSDKDEMFILGNVLDQGKFPIDLIEEMMGYSNVFPILGTNEYRFLRLMKDVPLDADQAKLASILSPEQKKEFSAWIKEGGRTTFEQFMTRDEEEREAILDYLSEFALYEELKIGKERYFLVHGGIRGFEPDKALDKYKPEDFLLDEPLPGKPYFENRMMIVGHTPTMDVTPDSTGKIFSSEYFINVNCGCIRHGSGGTLGCLCLDTMSEIYLL